MVQAKTKEKQQVNNTWARHAERGTEIAKGIWRNQIITLTEFHKKQENTNNIWTENVPF